MNGRKPRRNEEPREVMSKGKARFIVNTKGQATDRESYGERLAEYNAEFNRTVAESRNEDPITPEQTQKFLRAMERKNVKYTVKLGGGLVALGALSLGKASLSPAHIGWGMWSILGAVLVPVGALLIVYGVVVIFRDP